VVVQHPLLTLIMPRRMLLLLKMPLLSPPPLQLKLLQKKKLPLSQMLLLMHLGVPTPVHLNLEKLALRGNAAFAVRTSSKAEPDSDKSQCSAQIVSTDRKTHHSLTV
jgi:hypothetical protein